MRSVISAVSPSGYEPHSLHAPTRDWPETNCYVDLWIEVLSARGLDPEACLSTCVEMDFEGDQFTFFKIHIEDLSKLYDITIRELSIYDSLEGHCTEQVRRGCMPIVEVDAFHLPDTRGVSFGLEHSKTTIGINALDPDARTLHYFHNAGYFALEGDDYAGVFQHGYLPGPHSTHLFPYVEFAKFDGAPLAGNILTDVVRDVLSARIAAMPRENPLRAFARRLESQAIAVGAREPEFFHKYAFNTVRQVGANFELLGSHLRWIESRAGLAQSGAAEACAALSTQMKALQFQLARAVTRKRTDGLATLVDPAAASWDEISALLHSHFA